MYFSHFLFGKFSLLTDEMPELLNLLTSLLFAVLGAESRALQMLFM